MLLAGSVPPPDRVRGPWDQRGPFCRLPSLQAPGPAGRQSSAASQDRGEEVTHTPLEHVDARALPERHRDGPCALVVDRRDQQADVPVPVVVRPRDQSVPYECECRGVAVMVVGVVEVVLLLLHEGEQGVAALGVRQEQVAQKHGVAVAVHQGLVVARQFRPDPCLDLLPGGGSGGPEPLRRAEECGEVGHARSLPHSGPSGRRFGGGIITWAVSSFAELPGQQALTRSARGRTTRIRCPAVSWAGSCPPRPAAARPAAVRPGRGWR
ncbi:hypothetical protein SMICM304S_11160 [Streptomyces microflavus]